MENIFQRLGITEPHTLEQVRASIDADTKREAGFIAVLKEHHYYLEESISILIDPTVSIPEKRSHLERFLNLLEMHAKAEAETLYVHLQQNVEEEARLEGLAGEDEHDIAFQMIDELVAMNYKTQWNDEIAAKAKVLAAFIKNHIKEEESVMFSVAKKNLNEGEMEQMRIEYLEKCRYFFLH